MRRMRGAAGSSNPTLSAMVAHLLLTLEFSVGREPGTCFVCAACAARRAHQIPPSPPWLPTFYLRWNLASVGNLGLALYAPHARRGSSNPTLSAMVAHLLLRWNLASVGNLGLALYAPHARRGSSNPTLSAICDCPRRPALPSATRGSELRPLRDCLFVTALPRRRC